MTAHNELHRELQKQFDPTGLSRFTSTAQEARKAEDVESLLLDEEQRGRIPFTREDFVIREDPRRVEWEREVRKFLSRLNHDYGHRVTAPMIYEWATGVSLADLAAAEGVDPDNWRGGARWGSANVHLRHINWVLKEYFGKSYKTTIMGRPVGRAYTVRPQFRVQKKRPANITLLAEWSEGTLKP